MARQKDCNWKLPKGGDDTDPLGWEHVTVAVLMDLRDELKKLNQVFNCPNFQDIPNILRGIRKKLPSRKERTGK